MPSSHLSSASSKIPALLEPYVLDGAATRHDGSLTLVTSIQGAAANWLIHRYLFALLASKKDEPEEQDKAGVVLVSFMRDGAFWRDGCSRLGLDLEACRQAGRFTFVDGLTGMFAAKPAAPGPDVVLPSTNVDEISAHMSKAVAGIKSTKKVIIIDQMDTLLAVGGDDVDALKLQNMTLALRENVFSTVITLAADSPLIQEQTTTLEREHASMSLGMAHAADEVLSLRKLDTGAAGDVSGVIRISSSTEGRGADASVEVLYHVLGDGSVKVFERGS